MIGMAKRYERIRSFLFHRSRFGGHIIAIRGMGGSGKTTLAKYVYNSHWRTFEFACFLEDISRRCKERNDLLQLQEQLLNDIVRGKRRTIPSVSQGPWDTCYETKIIITTREDTNNWPWRIEDYKMELLNDKESSELLCCHAFDTNVPTTDFEDLVLDAVRYCGGNPLALEVLGSSLSIRNTISIWRSGLNSFQKDLDSRINDVLESSYKSLPRDPEKELFLHIACFFVAKDVDYVVKILDEPDYSAKFGIETLINRSLVSVSPNKKLMMHPLLQEMAKKIVRKESEKFPSKRSRVWLSSDSYKILSKGKGSETIEGLALDMHELWKAEFAFKSSELNTGALKNMDNLKLLQLNFAELNGSYENFSEDLRWLCWHGFHLTTIPSDLYMGNLVAIDMSNSNLEVFEPPMVLQSLQILNLKDSHNLLEIRNISRIPRLETLILWNCSSLNHVCKTIGDLESLTLLNMTGCKNLWKRELVNLSVASTSSGITMPAFSFPRSLHRLFLKDCYLECTDSLPLSFSAQPFLQYLNLVNGQFEYLPYYDHLNNLRVLDLSLCSILKCLLCLPSTLAELYIYYCESLEKITFQSHRFTLQEFGYEGCKNLIEIEGFIKLIPIAKLEEIELEHLKWLKAHQHEEVRLVGDDELTVGRSRHIQMLYEFNIMSVSLPYIKDPNMTPFISASTYLSFKVPSCPENKRLKGLNVIFSYTLESASDDNRVWFCKINTSNGVDVMYNPKVFGKPDYLQKRIWLSYWPIGNTLGVGDKVNVAIVVVRGLEVHECGATLVYTDDEEGKENMEKNMRLIDNLGADLSGFQLSTGSYYLCRRDFYELMKFGIFNGSGDYLFGDTFDYTEIRGWRKTGRPKHVIDPSYTELKTVRCIIDGPELEEIYKISEISKSPYGDKTVAFTSSLLEKEIKSVTKSESIDPDIEEIFEKPYVRDPEIVPNIIPNKIVQIVEFRSGFSKHFFMEDLLIVLKGIISIHFDKKDGRLTIIGHVDPMRVLSLLKRHRIKDIINVGPAEEHEQNKSYNPDNVEKPIIESASRSQEALKSVVSNKVSGQTIKKVVVGVDSGSQYMQRKAMEVLSRLKGVQSIHLDSIVGTITIIGDVDLAVRVLDSIDMLPGESEIISIAPAEEHEVEVGPAEKEMKDLKFGKS